MSAVLLRKETDMDYYRNCSDFQLLSFAIGKTEARRVYHGKLTPLFLCDAAYFRGQHRLLIARELVRRMLVEELKETPILGAPALVREYLRILFLGKEYEAFVVLFLNNRNCLLSSEEMFRGSLTQTSVYPREVVKLALKRNAACVIFAHNHPSGVAEPSRTDELLTRNLKDALALVDVKVLDHFVVGGGEMVSFAERGLI